VSRGQRSGPVSAGARPVYLVQGGLLIPRHPGERAGGVRPRCWESARQARATRVKGHPRAPSGQLRGNGLALFARTCSALHIAGSAPSPCGGGCTCVRCCACARAPRASCSQTMCGGRGRLSIRRGRRSPSAGGQRRSWCAARRRQRRPAPAAAARPAAAATRRRAQPGTPSCGPGSRTGQQVWVGGAAAAAAAAAPRPGRAQRNACARMGPDPPRHPLTLPPRPPRLARLALQAWCCSMWTP